MTSPLGTYSFLPWVRQGLANQIAADDFDSAVKVRAEVAVALRATGAKIGGGTESADVTRTVAIYGPGDIVGIDRRAIVRVEPRENVSNFEPNHLAHVEFYDEDFLWRYTPARPSESTGRLRPWIALVVLADGEFSEGKNVKDKPLPYVDVPELGVFPRPDELWAWAHVHVNRSLAKDDSEFFSTDMSAVIPKLRATLDDNPDLACSRLLCPRKLAPNTGYHAFIVPVFEAGRRAGLGLDLDDVVATASAWGPGTRPEAQSFPYYHRWFFRTGASGDFETLVRLLVPKPVDPRVGLREMDVQFPGSNVRGVDKPELGGILKLGGALKPPAAVPPEPPDKFETWDEPFPRPLELDLARLVNLPDKYQAEGEPDPIVAPPLYGTWHALSKRLLEERDGTPITPNDNWLHRLNLDPRFRVAAGIGTRVIQDQQEKFMDAAWEQVGKVLDAQKRVWRGQFGWLVSESWHERSFAPMLALSRQQALLLIAPLNKRLVSDGATLHFTQKSALVQPALTSAAFRRIVRPRGRLVRALGFDASQRLTELVERVNDGVVSAAPPKGTPAGLVTDQELAEQVLDTYAGGASGQGAASGLRLFLVLLLIVGVLTLVFLPWPLNLIVAGAALVVGYAIYRTLRRRESAVGAANAIREQGQTPAAVDALPSSSDFVISEPGSGFTPTLGGPDGVEADRFKRALRETFEVRQAGIQAGSVQPKRRLDLAKLADEGIRAIEPARTVPRRVMAGLFIPPRIKNGVALREHELFVEPMAYPVIDLPMYEPLKNLSTELFLPNIHLIPPNSITLLETNQRFIESYMVGLNHEFSRELLWREYPTDQRGSTFRQFWDVRSFFNADNLDDETLKESLRDIPPLHLWSKNSKLGEHDHREQGRENEEELVLVIRGELLKRYPNAVVYAHRACWQKKTVTPADADKEPCGRSGAIDNTVERRLVPLTPAEEERPPKSKVLTPLYEAKVEPDIYFFGFDLTVDKAKGGTGENPNDDPGWFFVIKERPGEPRFGLDDEQPAKLEVWNDLSWPQIQPNPPGAQIEIASTPATLDLHNPGAADEKYPQYLDDKAVHWERAKLNSSTLAYVLFQAPVLVGVHASEMLPK